MQKFSETLTRSTKTTEEAEISPAERTLLFKDKRKWHIHNVWKKTGLTQKIHMINHLVIGDKVNGWQIIIVNVNDGTLVLTFLDIMVCKQFFLIYTLHYNHDTADRSVYLLF